MPRPTIFTQEKLQKLEQAFALDCTDEEACLYADIAPSSLYNYQKQNKEFLERKKLLKQSPVLKARQELIKGLAGHPELCLKYLERKRKEEFSPRQEFDDKSMESVWQLEAQLRAIFERKGKSGISPHSE